MADPQPAPVSAKPRTTSISQASQSSQTAADFIKEQLSLEAEAREALPYQFDTCTRDLGPLRQSLYACLTCNPPPASPAQLHIPAGICYSCSISCHGEHTLVELFNKRDFVCDCGTTRTPDNAPCTLRLNPTTGQKGDVTGEEPARRNKYNQNFKNRFCGCGQDYDSHQEKGTMFQCLGLGTCEDGGCGEDWWHPECLVGYTREEYAKTIEKARGKETGDELDRTDNTIVQEKGETGAVPTETTNGKFQGDQPPDTDDEDNEDNEDPPLPPGFPPEDDFDHFLCYKCVQANPWVKKYAGSAGFLPPVYNDKALNTHVSAGVSISPLEPTSGESKKRKAPNEGEGDSSTNLAAPAPPKRQKSEDPSSILHSISEDTAGVLTLSKATDNTICKVASLPSLPTSTLTHRISLFLKPDFREHLCRCVEHFSLLKPHPQLLEEEDTYEPPVSEEGDNAAQSVGTASILDRGEAAFNNMDRVRAIQGAMAYAQLKDKVSAFLKPFAESGQAVGAEDVKAYFEKLRGDDQGIQDAAVGAKAGRKDGDEGGDEGKGGDGRKEQSGY